MPHRHSSYRLRTTLLLLAAVSLARALGAEPAPADLRLEWEVGSDWVRQAPPFSGRSGDTRRIVYRLRNVGGSDAFAATIEAHTALGRQGPPRRVQPGPQAGRASVRRLELPLASGMRELCLSAQLVRVDKLDPGDPNPSDNRLCRRVDVEASSEDTAAGARHAAAVRLRASSGRSRAAIDPSEPKGKRR